MLAALTMEVGDLNRAQNNGVNAVFDPTLGGGGQMRNVVRWRQQCFKSAQT